CRLLSYKTPAPPSPHRGNGAGQGVMRGRKLGIGLKRVAVSAATDGRFSFFLLFLCCFVALVAIYGSGLSKFRVGVKIFSIFLQRPAAMPARTVTAANTGNLGRRGHFFRNILFGCAPAKLNSSRAR
ncbi:MAG: hypothetical protein ACJ8G3_10790, partial [Burkholderiaceae bacterium]